MHTPTTIKVCAIQPRPVQIYEILTLSGALQQLTAWCTSARAVRSSFRRDMSAISISARPITSAARSRRAAIALPSKWRGPSTFDGITKVRTCSSLST